MPKSQWIPGEHKGSKNVVSRKQNSPGEQPGESADIQSLAEIGLSRFAPYLMNRIMGRWNADLQERMAGNDMSVVKMRTLAVLSVMSGLTINQLSVYAIIEQSTISRSLDAMEEQGFIRRETSASDGRVREIHITNKGRKTFDAFWPAMHQNYQKLFIGIDQGEQDALFKTLHKMLNNIRKNPL
jgi:DNA-binding MarR family transcriptional regulator